MKLGILIVATVGMQFASAGRPVRLPNIAPQITQEHINEDVLRHLRKSQLSGKSSDATIVPEVEENPDMDETVHIRLAGGDETEDSAVLGLAHVPRGELDIAHLHPAGMHFTGFASGTDIEKAGHGVVR